MMVNIFSSESTHRKNFRMKPNLTANQTLSVQTPSVKRSRPIKIRAATRHASRIGRVKPGRGMGMFLHRRRHRNHRWIKEVRWRWWKRWEHRIWYGNIWSCSQAAGGLHLSTFQKPSFFLVSVLVTTQGLRVCKLTTTVLTLIFSTFGRLEISLWFLWPRWRFTWI